MEVRASGLTSTPSTFIQIEGLRRFDLSPRLGSARRRQVKLANTGTTPRRAVVQPQAQEHLSQLQGDQPQARVPKPPAPALALSIGGQYDAQDDEAPESPEACRAEAACLSHYRRAHRQVVEWQERFEDEGARFQSVQVWADMTMSVASKSPGHTVAGKLMRIEAAMQMIKKISALVEHRSGRAYTWALQQLHDSIFSTPDAQHCRDPQHAAYAAEIESVVEPGCVATYFQLYDYSLLWYARSRGQIERQKTSLRALHRVLNCALDTYRLKIKGFVFTSWRKHSKVSKSQNKALVALVANFFRKNKMRRALTYWGQWARANRTEREKCLLDDANKRLGPLVKSLEAKLDAVTASKGEEINQLEGELLTSKQSYLAAAESFRQKERELKSQIDQKTALATTLQAVIDSKVTLLQELSPGYLTRVAPSKALLYQSANLKEVVVTCRAQLKFPLLLARAVEELIVVWVKEQTDCRYPLTIADLATEHISVLESLLTMLAKENAPQDEGATTVEKMRACFLAPPFNAPPLNLLAHTPTVTATLTNDFMNTPLFNGKLLKVLCSLFLLYECYSHLTMDCWHFTSCENMAGKLGKLDKLTNKAVEKKRPVERRAARVLHTLKTIQQTYAEDDSGLYDPSPAAAGEDDTYDVTFDAEYDSFINGLTPLSCNRAWTGIGTLVSLYLGRAKQKQMVAAISRSKDPNRESDSDNTDEGEPEGNW